MNSHDRQSFHGRSNRSRRGAEGFARVGGGRSSSVRDGGGSFPDPGGPSFYAPSESWNVGGSSGVGGAQGFQEYSRANYGRQMMSARARGKRRLWTVVLVVASLVLVACLAVLGVIAWGYYSGTKAYDEIAQSADVVTEANALAEMTVDWDALLAQNPDTVAWIYMPGTSIDYPVVQGDSDEEYLRKDFAGNEGGIVSKGSIFLSAINSSDFSDDNNFIYGHNMNDDTMFAHLVAMEKQETFDSTSVFYILTPSRNYRCTALALDVVANTETSIIQPAFSDSAALASYVRERMDGASAAASDVDLASISKLFTLITCGDDYATTRAVLFGGVIETAVPANVDQVDGASSDMPSSDEAAIGDEAGGESADSAGQAA